MERTGNANLQKERTLGYMNVLGVDCSSKAIDMVMVDEEGEWVTSFTARSKLKTMDERMAELSNQAEEFISKQDIGFCAVESPLYLQNPKTTIYISQVVGIVKSAMARYRITCLGVDNTTWKRVIVGKGNASKQDIADFSVRKFGDARITSFDISDASCIALWGLNIGRHYGKLD